MTTSHFWLTLNRHKKAWETVFQRSIKNSFLALKIILKIKGVVLTLLLGEDTQGSIPWVSIQKRWIKYRLGRGEETFLKWVKVYK